jgi:hypothetical protein
MNMRKPPCTKVGLLFDNERAELLTRWREEFDRAQEPGFAHCIGHAKPGDTFATWLSGKAAKRGALRVGWHSESTRRAVGGVAATPASTARCQGPAQR